MALDVFLGLEAGAQGLLDVVDGDPLWRVQRTRWRRRLTSLMYQNPATEVAFTVDLEAAELSDGTPGLSAYNGRLNVLRPDFYGREAVSGLATLAARSGTSLMTRPPDGPAGVGPISPVTPDTLLEQWREANALGLQWRTADGRTGARTTRAAADAFWTWQWGLKQRRAELASTCWLPKLFWMQDTRTGRAVTATLWSEGQAEAVAAANIVMYLPDVRGTGEPIVLQQEDVLTAVEDLLVTITASDGTDVRYLPFVHDADCRRRAAALAAGRPRLRDTDYEPVSTYDLDDRPD